MRLRGAWCTDRGSLTESRVSSSTARAFTHASLPYRAATPATAAMATAEDIGAHVFDEGHWYHETLEEGLAISYRVRARAARSIVVVTAAASERRTTDALSESSSPSIRPPPLAVAVLARFAPASTPPREPNLARRSSAPERSLALALSRARVLVAVAPPALTHSSVSYTHLTLPTIYSV